MVMNDGKLAPLGAHVPRVMGFIAAPLDRTGADQRTKKDDAIMNRLHQVGDKPRPKTCIEPGEMVRVNDGPVR